MDKTAFELIIERLKQNNVIVLNLNLAPKQLKELFQALRTNTSVRSLRLSWNGIDSFSAYHLGRMLKVNRSLKELYLDNNPLCSVGISFITDALKTNTTLSKLDLSRSCRNKMGVKCIAELLETNTTLTSLDLSNNKLTNDRIERLFAALTKNPNSSLAHLHLRDNELSNCIKPMINSLDQLKTLDLAHNLFNDKDVIMLANALKENKSLLTLDLSDNCITQYGLAMLPEMLEDNTTLKILKLQKNLINNSTAQLFAQALTKNVSLVELDLSDNKINGYSASHFTKTLKERDIPIKIIFASNPITPDRISAAFNQLLDINTAIVSLLGNYAFMNATLFNQLIKLLKEREVLRQPENPHTVQLEFPSLRDLSFDQISKQQDLLLKVANDRNYLPQELAEHLLDHVVEAQKGLALQRLSLFTLPEEATIQNNNITSYGFKF